MLIGSERILTVVLLIWVQIIARPLRVMIAAAAGMPILNSTNSRYAPAPRPKSSFHKSKSPNSSRACCTLACDNPIQLTTLLHFPARATARRNFKDGEGLAVRPEVPYKQHPPPVRPTEEDGRESSQFGAIKLPGANSEAEAFPRPRRAAENAGRDRRG